ncbi:MAG: DUF2007 domain-containing protein [Rhodospirillales bacterium]|nr:DUF2007 domain-containing protein [Rhodospirillales bacterium]
MVELIRTNDPVLLSWLQARLAEEGIHTIVLDAHTSVLEGSILAIQRRVMVAEGQIIGARRVLAEAEDIAQGKA